MPFDVTVVALDLFGITDRNFHGTVAFSTSDPDPGVMLPADYTLQPSDGGTVTFTNGVTLITPGDQTLAVTDMNGGITGIATITVTSPAAPPAERGRGAQQRALLDRLFGSRKGLADDPFGMDRNY
jgi:hypothetical protein